MKFLLIKRSYFCVLHPLLGPQIKFMNFLENQPTLIFMSHWVHTLVWALPNLAQQIFHRDLKPTERPTKWPIHRCPPKHKAFGNNLFRSTYLIQKDHQKDHQFFILIIQMEHPTKRVTGIPILYHCVPAMIQNGSSKVPPDLHCHNTKGTYYQMCYSKA